MCNRCCNGNIVIVYRLFMQIVLVGGGCNMTNYEFYKSEIEAFLLEHGDVIFGVREGELKECGMMACDKCEINPAGGKCRGLRKAWLNSEHNQWSIPADTPIDTKVLVSNDGEKWYKRYFYHFGKDERKPYVCLGDGTTSWSCDDDYTCWQYCKLWEGDEEE